MKTKLIDVTNEWYEYKKIYVKKSTFSTYYSKLSKYINHNIFEVLLIDIKKEMFLDFIRELKEQKQLSTSYINDLIVILNSILLYAHEKYGIDLIKISTLKSSKKQITIFNDIELKKIVEFCLKNTNFDKLGLLISLFTGVRLGELCGLKWSDIDINLKYLKIERTVQRIKNFNMSNASKTIIEIGEPKSMSSKRQIIIVDELLKIITKLRRKDNLFILSNDETPLDPRSFEIRYKKLLEQVSVDYKNFHTCRHTFATNCIRSGMNPKILSQVLGHASVKTTLDLYVHPNMEEMAQNMEFINERIKLHS